MSDRDNPRSLVEIMNDVLSTVREHYDSEYVYYIEKEYEDIDVIYEWCAKHVPWQRDKIKMLPKDQRPRWMEQEITDTTEDSYSVFRRLDENTVAILAAVGVHRGGCEVDLLRSVLAYLPEAITLQKLQKQQEYLSYHDKLTGLYNRNSFVSYTTDINPDELNSLGAVSVDINGLKNFNKEFGRDYGDEVVIRVGEVLEEYFHTANVYRMTGDEYLVLVENITYEEFMKQVKALCEERDILMILDEIQCGMGRCGEYYAWQRYGIKPDIMTSAKALGCGVPVGAFMMTEKVAAHSLTSGDHGTTYGGNPLAGAAINAVLDLFEENHIIEHVNQIGDYLANRLDELVDKYDFITERRGVKLMQGLVFDRPVGDIIGKALEKGLILINAGSNIIRFVPPLVIEEEHVDKMIEILTSCLQ